MKIRRARAGDQKAAEKLHAEAGYAFKFPDIESQFTECAFVVEDDANETAAVVVARRSPEIVMAMRKQGHPLVKLHTLALIHDAMKRELTALGYKEANCFVPPEIDRSYGRHLQKIFGWLKSWQGYTIRG